MELLVLAMLEVALIFVFWSWCMFRWSEFCWLGSCTNYGPSTVLHLYTLTRDPRHLFFFETCLLILHTFYAISFSLYLHSLILVNHFQNLNFYLFCPLNSFSTLKDLPVFSSMAPSLMFVYPFRIVIMFSFSNAFVLRININGAY